MFVAQLTSSYLPMQVFTLDVEVLPSEMNISSYMM